MTDLLLIDADARRTYEQVQANGPARPPPEEIYRPRIDRGIANKPVYVHPPEDDSTSEGQWEQAYLSWDGDATQVYRLITSLKSVQLNHHGAGWGHVHFAVILTRLAEQVYQAPQPDQAVRVAIKQLRKRIVQRRLNQAATAENPYRELLRMQELGFQDDHHRYYVLPCIEALEDDEYLYIVTPFCEQSLEITKVPNQVKPPSLDECRQIWKDVTQDLLFLHQHGICHHDISPDNFLYYQGHYVLMDLAMSIPIPRNNDPTADPLVDHPYYPWRRTIITKQHASGTLPCQAPEVFQNAQFDGSFVDLWGATIVLYYLLSGGLTLYDKAHPGKDVRFLYFLYLQSIAPQQQSPKQAASAERLLQKVSESVRKALLAQREWNEQIPPLAMTMIYHLLQVFPKDRWTLAQAMEHEW